MGRKKDVVPPKVGKRGFWAACCCCNVRLRLKTDQVGKICRIQYCIENKRMHDIITIGSSEIKAHPPPPPHSPRKGGEWGRRGFLSPLGSLHYLAYLSPVPLSLFQMRSPLVHTLHAWEKVMQTYHERLEETSRERQYIYMGGELRDILSHFIVHPG